MWEDWGNLLFKDLEEQTNWWNNTISWLLNFEFNFLKKYAYQIKILKHYKNVLIESQIPIFEYHKWFMGNWIWIINISIYFNENSDVSLSLIYSVKYELSWP